MQYFYEEKMKAKSGDFSLRADRLFPRQKRRENAV